VWLVDLGMTAKIRPCLVMSVPPGDSDRSLVTLVPHTTSVRESRFEVVVSVGFLKPGAFDAKGIVTIPLAWLVRKVGTLSGTQMKAVEIGVCNWLGIEHSG
jgi:mRNA interferase MazF